MDQWKQLAKVVKKELPKKTIAGRWQVGELLDEGGMGVVFNCTQLGTTDSENHVVKIVPEGQVAEAFAALKLKHECLMPAIDAGIFGLGVQDSQQPIQLCYIVMPKAGQGSLGDWMDEYEVYPSMVPWIVADISSALEYLHCQPGSPLVHRDLKPENIFLMDEHWCLADWGIMRTGSYADTVYATAATTLDYAPPEYFDQQRGYQVPIKPSWDVYQLGLITLELLTRNLWKQKHQDLPADYPDLQEYSVEIQSICTGCLRTKPEARIPVSDILALAEASKYRVFKDGRKNESSNIVWASDDPLDRDSAIVWADDDQHGQHSSIQPIIIDRVGYHLYALFSGQKSPRPKNEAMREVLRSGSATYATNSGKLRILEYDHRSRIFALWETGALDFDIETYRAARGSNVGDRIDDLEDARRLVYGILPLEQIREDQRLRRLWL